MIRFASFLIWLGRLEWRFFASLPRFFVLSFSFIFRPLWMIWRLGIGLFRIFYGFKLVYSSAVNDIRNLKKRKQIAKERAIFARQQNQFAQQEKILAKLQEKQIKQQERQQYLETIKSQPKQFLLKPALAFAVLLMVIMLPIKFYDTFKFFQRLEDKIMNFSQAAVGQLNQGKSAALASDFHTAGSSFSQASQDFVSAGKELAGVDGLLLSLLKVAPNDKLKLAASGQKLVLAGQLGAGLAADLSEAADVLFTKRSGKNFSEVLTAFSIPGQRAVQKLDQLNPVLAEINANDLPTEYRQSFQSLKDKSAMMSASLKELLLVTDQLQIFLGRDIDKRYLMVFQNNTEVRASGGFMGSFAIMDFKQGQIKKMQSPGGGTYDTEGGLRRLVQAPKPMWLVNPLWHMWDANWWPDWPKSAQKVMWFYEKSDGSTVDGVISLTPTVIIKLLDVLGPIDLTTKHGVIITGENFMNTVQEIAEQKQNVTKEPKQIIGDMLAVIMDKMATRLDRDDWLKIIKVLESSLNEKDILIYFTDPSLQSKVKEMGWDGGIKEASGDYLSVINTNIAGGKSDKKIIQTITHQASLTTDGSIIDTVTIVRDHQAIKREPFTGVRNVNWLRVYVPLGSRLISSEGWRQPEVTIEGPDPSWEFDQDLLNESEADRDPVTGTIIYRELDKTVFANWSMVDPGEMAVIKLVYKLPFKAVLDTNGKSETAIYKYTLMAQKQSGSHNSEISSSLVLPANLSVAWRYPEQNTDSFYQQNVDRMWGYLISNK